MVAASEVQQRLGVLPEQFPLDFRRVVGVFGEVRRPLNQFALEDGEGENITN